LSAMNGTVSCPKYFLNILVNLSYVFSISIFKTSNTDSLYSYYVKIISQLF
jgi:hypothetical protein